jgi:hypothetical protein
LTPAEILETRLALNGQMVFGDLRAPGSHPFPDGLHYDDPLVGAAIAAITTTAPAEQFLALEDFQQAAPVLAPNGLPGADLVQSTELIELPALRNDSRFAGIDGTGFSVVVLDTGIDLDHPFFGPDSDGNGVADRIVFNADFITGGASANDVHGHGSHVSSIIASEDPVYGGIAPGANIIHLQVLDAAGFGTASAIEAALQWVVANAATYNVASVNMSLGFGDNLATASARPDRGFGDELAALAALGVITVSSSGNGFQTHASAPGVSYPAADPNSLSVGAVWDADVGGGVEWSSGARDNSTGADRIVSFSQRHPTLTTVFAPGAFITAAAPGGGTAVLSGTSMAAPHVAGVAALMQQLAVQVTGQRLSVSEFAVLLDVTGVPILDGDDEDDNVVNTQHQFHRVDVLALANAIASNGLSDLAIAGEVKVSSSPIAAGGRARVNFTVANQSVTGAGSFDTKIYLSTDAVIDESDVLLDTVVDEIGPGAVRRRTGHAVEMPASFAPGSYFLGVVLDAAGAVAEGNEQNNIAVLPVTVAADISEIEMVELSNELSVVSGATAVAIGQAHPGAADIVKTFRVYNDGSIDLSLSSLATPAGFIVAGFPETVAPRAEVDFTITLPASNHDAIYGGVISFATNDSDESAFSFSITGSVDHPGGPDAATLLPVNSSVESAIGVAGDLDWYKFDAVSDVQYRIETTLGTLGDSVLRLIDTDGVTQLEFNDNADNLPSSRIAWTAPVDGPYFIEVSGKTFGKGSYELSLLAADDHGDDAVTATATSDPSTNFGAISASGDADWFSFSAEEGVSYRFEVLLDTLPGAVLQLIGQDGTSQLLTATIASEPAAPLEWTAPQSGVYFLSVSASAPSTIGSFQLAITGADDHGDNAPNATDIPTPATTAGIVESTTDVDWFSFTAVEGAQYELRTIVTGRTNSLIRLIDVNGVTELAADDNGGPSFASLIEWTAPASGAYFIEVAGVGHRFGPYELVVGIVDDHGDAAAAATATSDPSHNPGVIESSDDTDWFAFEAIAGVSYHFETELGELSASDLQLVDRDGVTVLATSATGNGPASLIDWTAPDSGQYYLQVKAAAHAQLGTYNLAIRGDDDHGDNPPNATAISIPNRVNGTIERQDDRDWFSFALVAGVDYRFEFVVDSAAATVRLYEADGVTEVAAAAGSSGAPGTLDWSATTNAAYFLEVSTEAVVGASSESNAVTTYSLKNTIVGRVPGDYNDDANVDGLDFLNWQRTFASTTDLAADGDNDGVVTGLDLDIWRLRFGLALAGPSFQAVGAVTAELRSEPGGVAQQSAPVHWPDAWRGAWLAPEPPPNRAHLDVAFQIRRDVYRPEEPSAAHAEAVERCSDAHSAALRPAATPARQAKTGAERAGDAADSQVTDAEFDAAITLLFPAPV